MLRTVVATSSDSGVGGGGHDDEQRHADGKRTAYSPGPFWGKGRMPPRSMDPGSVNQSSALTRRERSDRP